VLLALAAKLCDTADMNTAIAPKPLDVEVRELLESRRGTWQEVAKGADVSHSWISQFMRGKIDNPGFGTLNKLRDHLRA
jgi:transcriptional regulator with XRE-family HTH domain